MLTRMTDAHWDIVQRIDAEIHSLRERLTELELARRLVLELRSTPAPPVPPREPMQPTGRSSLVEELKHTETYADAIEAVLRFEGERMDSRAIAERLALARFKGNTLDDLESMRGMVRATVSRDNRFTAESRGTYGLTAWIDARAWRVPSARRESQYDESTPAAPAGAVAAGATHNREVVGV